MPQWIQALWKPVINPDNGKALTIPILNPIDIYGRNFHLAWLGFFVAFLSWFAFPPLIHEISGDLGSTPEDVANCNITALSSTLVARLILGPLCDRFGPRRVMAANLLVGAIPTAFVPLVNSKSGLFAVRFFIGFLGGTFVPCQVWCTMFFDKRIVGLATSLAGGWGNAGGGVAFFTMPAVMNGFLNGGYSNDHAWKYSFVVFPLIVIMVTAALCLFLGQDCPQGDWSQRNVEVLNGVRESSDASDASRDIDKEKQLSLSPVSQSPVQSREFYVDPSPAPSSSTLQTIITTFHYSTMITALPYAASFGSEIAIESIISSFYMAHARKVGQTWSTQLAGNWGSMLGLLNVVCRPLGGYISDLLYRRYKSPYVKKIWMIACGVIQGVFMLYIGLYGGISMPGIIVSLGFMCLFMEMANGAIYALVPHINPARTGVVSGSTGSFGNVGGILLSLPFRFRAPAEGSLNNEYQAAIWYIGVAVMSVYVLVATIPFGRSLER